jgi:hypothetical protein
MSAIVCDVIGTPIFTRTGRTLTVVVTVEGGGLTVMTAVTGGRVVVIVVVFVIVESSVVGRLTV